MEKTMTHVKEMNGLKKRLAGVWKRGRRFALHRSGCVILLVAIALFTVVFLLDWRMALEGGARLALVGISVFFLALTGYLTWWRYRRPYDPVSCALEVERKHPEFGGLLVSYVQFHDKGIAHEGASPSLVAAMLRQAEEQSHTVSFQDVVRFRVIWKLYLTVMITCMAVVIAAAMRPGFAKAFVVRLLNPFSDKQYPTRTVLDETSGDLVIQQGRSVLLRAVVSGVVPEEMAIRFPQQGGAEELIRVAKGESAGSGSWVFAHEIKDAQRDFNYMVLAGDAVSRMFHVRVVHGPVQRIEAEVIYPAYLERSPAQVSMPGFEAPMGAKIQWNLHVDRPISKGRMILDDDKSVPISLANDYLSGSVLLTPKDSFTYGLEWTDKESGFVYGPSVRYPVRMVPDQAPKIIMKPAATEEKATVWKIVDLAFTATDDYGLASARLAYKVSRAKGDPVNANEITEEILIFPKVTTQTAENLKWRVRDSIPNLAPGDVVSYSVEVLDRQPAPGGPGVGRSETRMITVVTQEEYVTLSMEKRRRLLSRIKNLHDEEIDADKAIQSFLKDAPKENGPNPESK